MSADESRVANDEESANMLEAVSHAHGTQRKDLKALLDDYERKLILLALDAAGGHQRRAAASLGLLPSTLSQKMKRLGVRRTVKVAWTAGEDPRRDPAEEGPIAELSSE